MTARHQVVVVGTGPVGLALVLGLRRLGVDVIGLDRGSGPTDYPKARLLNARSMELLRRWGVAPEVIRLALLGGWPDRIVVARSGTGEELARLEKDFSDMARTSPERSTLCTQDKLEPVLFAALAGLDAHAVRWHTQVIGVEQNDAVVTVSTQTPDGRTATIEAEYMVFADGSRGMGAGDAVPGAGVRRVHGREVSLRTHIALGRWASQRPAFAYYLVGRRLSAQMLVVDGDREWVLSTLAGRSDTVQDYPPERVRQLLVSISGLPEDDPVVAQATVSEIKFFELALRVADEFRVGRVLRAGDAAHEILPTGAMGLNVGLGDVDSLVWRLAGVTKGWAGPAVLDGYAIERRAVAVRAAAWTRANLNTLTRILGAAARDDSVALLDAVESFRTYVEHPGLDFPPTPSSGVPDSDELTADGRPGTRMPHLPVGAGGSTLDACDDSTPVLVLDSASGTLAEPLAQLADRTNVPLKLTDMRGVRAGGTAWWCHCGVGPGGALLLRPDGYVSWRTESLTVDSMDDLTAALQDLAGLRRVGSME